MFDCEDLVVTCHPQIKREWIQMLFFIILVCRVTFIVFNQVINSYAYVLERERKLYEEGVK